MVFSSFSQQISVSAHLARALPAQLLRFWRNMQRVLAEKKDCLMKQYLRFRNT